MTPKLIENNQQAEFHIWTKKGPTLSRQFYFFIEQSKTANDRESHFGLGYQKYSIESEGDDPAIGTFALIYWNHFS